MGILLKLLIRVWNNFGLWQRFVVIDYVLAIGLWFVWLIRGFLKKQFLFLYFNKILILEISNVRMKYHLDLKDLINILFIKKLKKK